ncbi:purine-nucleoside phosphorylase [Paraflavitalea pollutisoli]|uniref:purine-nucleoside phosphorylase n=1 Tax=Paraflavitalea pollutisoli TaxID=3034143 RepID=UPI0023EB3E50|nr:purine-nucleoside phosphorylase [Paraflavitalea sp. H1-2-19X]
MADIIQHLRETTAFIQQQYPHTPEAGIVLGSGLGNFASEIKVEKEIPYGDIPHFPVSTVEGHSGRLIFGELGGRRIVAMAGRFHFYEGYSAEQVTYPIRVMKMLGIQNLLLSNAAGGVNPHFKVGDLMLITDHISFSIVNPLLGKNQSELGPRFPDMSEPYSKSLQLKVKDIAAKLGITLRQGVYYGVTGPTFETRAEYKMIHALGGDAVGMSTVQEVIVAAHMSLPVTAISIITDLGIREEENVITHEEVLEAAAAAEPKLSAIFKELLAAL